MFKDIPFCFRDRNEDYLVINKLQEFCKENNVELIGLDKIELIKSIINFAKLDEEKEVKVFKWMDDTLKEGIKKVMVTKITNIRRLKNKTKEEWENLIKSSFNIEKPSYIINSMYSNNIKLCGYNFSKVGEKIDIVSLNFTILLKEQKNKELPYDTIIYPIFVDIYLEKGYIVGRSKSKSSLFKFKIESEEFEESYEPTNYEKLIRETFEKIYLRLHIEQESKESSIHKLKSSIHLMVDECTKTPKEIVEKLEEEREYREKFVKDFFLRKSIDPLNDQNYQNALKDIEVFMEKYLSINSLNKEIFTRDRYAYPIQISATDSDFSSVEESSMEETPLQCTPIFFDNKKLIQKQKKCDNVSFIFKRKTKTYFPNKKFLVTLEVKKGFMYIDFRKYVLEEDIKSVLSRIIRCD